MRLVHTRLLTPEEAPLAASWPQWAGPLRHFLPGAENEGRHTGHLVSWYPDAILP